MVFDLFSLSLKDLKTKEGYLVIVIAFFHVILYMYFEYIQDEIVILASIFLAFFLVVTFKALRIIDKILESYGIVLVITSFSFFLILKYFEPVSKEIFYIASTINILFFSVLIDSIHKINRDYVILRTGKQIYGRVVEEKDYIIVDTDYRTIKIPKSEIIAIAKLKRK